ncbi:hypothetical protein [Uliginosibacterium sp. H1]|uniref:hypothetical protein n=1 Tax=Uliginosibacterium sp. H1 TaxID=3114757 RepID=UPI002E17DEF3|nr:hypothetical protein [Uliginosibacterium sp. H1]
MLLNLLRTVFIVIGALLIYETTLPVRGESLLVDRLSEETKSVDPSERRGTENYILHFAGDGQLTSCTVSRSAYERIEAGDRLDVEYTPLLRQCVSIRRGAEAIVTASHWKTLSVVFGVLLIGLVIFRIKPG